MTLDHYVYAHLNPITLSPFYIGKGKGRRLNDRRKRSPFWNRIVSKYGLLSIKLVDGISNEMACEIEKQYIVKYGFLKSGGKLVNVTAGGDGGNTFDPTGGKNWNSGKRGIYSDLSLKKMSEAKQGKSLSDKQRTKVLAGLTKARAESLKSRTHKVQCLLTDRIWEGRQQCMKELGITEHVYEQRIWKNRPIKGIHLQLIKK